MKVVNTHTKINILTKGLHSVIPHFRTPNQLLTHLKIIRENLHLLPDLANNTLRFKVKLDETNMGYYDKTSEVKTKVQDMLPSALAYCDMLKYVEKLETLAQSKFKTKVGLHRLLNQLKLTLSILIDSCIQQCKQDVSDTSLLRAASTHFELLEKFSIKDYYSGKLRVTTYLRLPPQVDATDYPYDNLWLTSTLYEDNHYLNLLTEFRLPSRNDVGYYTPTLESIDTTLLRLLKQEGLLND